MNGNRKGPDNLGSKSGRGFGYCNGNSQPGFESDQPGRGMRKGKRQICGSRNRGFAKFENYDSTIADLKKRIEKLEQNLSK